MKEAKTVKTGIQALVGKEVYIFPGDTHYKKAILVSWDKDSGYEFLITDADFRADQKEGETWYYNNATKMILKEA